MKNAPEGRPASIDDAQIRRRKRRRKQRGAALVEFALIAPFLITLLFGVIEFSWVFSQVLDMRHGAREGARLAAVNFDSTGSGNGTTQRDELVTETCSRVDEPGATRVTLSFVSANTSVGGIATIRTERDLDTLTGFFDTFLGGLTPNSEVNFRLEQDAGWIATPVAGMACP